MLWSRTVRLWTAVCTFKQPECICRCIRHERWWDRSCRKYRKFYRKPSSHWTFEKWRAVKPDLLSGNRRRGRIWRQWIYQWSSTAFVKWSSEISWDTVCVGWIFAKWIWLFWIRKLLPDTFRCKEYRKINGTGIVWHLYAGISVRSTARRSDLLYRYLRCRSSGNAYRNLCGQWSDDPLWASGTVYVHQLSILAESFLWIRTMVRKRAV